MSQSTDETSGVSYGADVVRQALGIETLDLANQGQDLRAARVLVMPSFHAEGAITAMQRGGSTELQVTALPTSLWYRLSEPEGTTANGQAWVESATLSAPATSRLWAEIANLSETDFPDLPDAGVDGIDVHGEYLDLGRLRGFHAWSPRSTTPQGEFVRCLYAAATDIVGPVATVYLEQLHGYLDLGLPFKYLGGRPRVLRIFGSLSSLDADDLQRTLAAVPGHEPVVMDFSNLDGMGSLLHSIFESFATRAGPTGWVTSPSARLHLEAIGVPPSRLFSTVAVACEAVGGSEIHAPG